ncbi:MAG: hypothetical protein IH613_10990 [Desulfuromonadales bacterium]|nr:hypothetical protein [Desulfuromonadales bacterium]
MPLKYGRLDNFDYERMDVNEEWFARDSIILLTSLEMESKGYFLRDDAQQIYWKVYLKYDEFVLSCLFANKIKYHHNSPDILGPGEICIDTAYFMKDEFLSYLSQQDKIQIDLHQLKNLSTEKHLNPSEKQIQKEKVLCVPNNIFTKQGVKWLTKYNGKVCFFDDWKGLTYIYEIISRPCTPISSEELYRVVNPVDPDLIDSNQRIDNLFNDDSGFGMDKPFVDSLLSDKDSYKKICELIEQLEEEQFRITCNENLEELDHKIKGLNKIKSEFFKPSGLPKHSRIGLDKVNASVSKEYYRVLERVEKENNELALHLRQYIKTGSEYVYDSNGKIEWSTEKWSLE